MLHLLAWSVACGRCGLCLLRLITANKQRHYFVEQLKGPEMDKLTEFGLGLPCLLCERVTHEAILAAVMEGIIWSREGCYTWIPGVPQAVLFTN